MIRSSQRIALAPPISVLFSFAWLALLSFFILLSFMDGFLAALDPNQVDLFNRLAPPSRDHILGTDDLGRDILVRLIHGTTISITVAVFSTLISGILGTLIGLITGYFGGWTDQAGMRFTDLVIALPLLPLLIVVSAMDFSKIGLGFLQENGVLKIIIIISLVGWTTIARLVRAEVMVAKNLVYVRAATGLGMSRRSLIARHIFPNLLSPIIVASSITIGAIILFETVLSFLGLGIHPPHASWGNMLTSMQDQIWEAPWQAIFPGLMILLTVFSFNRIGDWVQQRLNPKSAQHPRS